jgi:hypothetical protein
MLFRDSGTELCHVFSLFRGHLAPPVEREILMSPYEFLMPNTLMAVNRGFSPQKSFVLGYCR